MTLALVTLPEEAEGKFIANKNYILQPGSVGSEVRMLFMRAGWLHSALLI